MWMEKIRKEESRDLYFQPKQEHHGHVTSRDANWIQNFNRKPKIKRQLERCSLTGVMTVQWLLKQQRVTL
jgi:hypothetical protein